MSAHSTAASQFSRARRVVLQWGVAGVDRSRANVFDETDLGAARWDEAFDLSDPEAQRAVLRACDEPLRDPRLQVGAARAQDCRAKAMRNPTLPTHCSALFCLTSRPHLTNPALLNSQRGPSSRCRLLLLGRRSSREAATTRATTSACSVRSTTGWPRGTGCACRCRRSRSCVRRDAATPPEPLPRRRDCCRCPHIHLPLRRLWRVLYLSAT